MLRFHIALYITLRMTYDLNLSIVNERSVENLIEIFESIYTRNNLLVLNNELTSLINFLTPFLRLKEVGKFDKLVKYDQFDEWRDAIESFDGLIVLVDEESQGNEKLLELSRFIDKVKTRTKVYLVVQNLTKSTVYQLRQYLSATTVNSSGVVEQPVGARHVKLLASVRLYNWEVNPVLLDQDHVFSLEMANGGLNSYFEQPLELLSKLSQGFIQLLALSPEFTGSAKLLKLRNIYAKGDHASLLVKLIQNDRIPDFLNLKFSALEQQFYYSKLKGNVDLVVLERNLDFASVAFNQLNYQGLIDDLWGIKNNKIQHLTTQLDLLLELLDDTLYFDLQDLNFATIGSKLNQLARSIQSEFLKKDNLTSITEIKTLVSNLGPLTNKQELIKKHTEISESILNYMKFGNITDDPKLTQFNTINEYEVYLGFQNDLFDLDYKQQIFKLKEFLEQRFSLKIIILSLILVSIVNDGIKERDYDQISEEVVQNFGIEGKFTLDSLVTRCVIKVVSGQSDYLGALSFRSTAITSTGSGIGAGVSGGIDESVDDESSDYSNLDMIGILGGQSGIKGQFSYIDKFLNLHPQANEETIEEKDGSLLKEYPNPTFALPASTVPIITRLVESLYLRDFLTYKPVNNLSRRANWDNLGYDTMFQGKLIDINVCDTLDEKKKKKPISRASTSTVTSSVGNHVVDYVILVMIGGITRSEISCLKYLEQRINQDKSKSKKKFLILTSGIVNGEKLINSCH